MGNVKSIVTEISFMNKSSSFQRFSQVALSASALLLSLVWPVAQAAEIPGLDKMVLLNAREQSVDQFFGELFGQVGVPARVDESITGSVNGDFRNPAGQVMSEILAAFQLAVYFDGAVAHVYPVNDISREMLYMPPSSAKSISRAAQKLGMLDSRNTLSVTDMGLVVTGAQRFNEQIERLASAVGKKTKTTVATHDTYEIFKLKYAWADDVSMVFGGESVVIPGVASLIRSLIEPGALGVAKTTRTQGSSSLDGLRGQGLSSRGAQEVAIYPGSSELPPGVDQSALSGLVSGGSTAKTRIVADPLSNSVIIRDRADRMATYKALIESLDKEPQMIEIEATIIDLDTDKLRELGINWRLQRGNDQALFGNGTVSDELLRPDTEITPSANGGVVSLVLGSRQQFISRIRALETQGAARIVSKPHVMTLSNVEALLDTTSTFFVRVAGQEEVDLFDVKVGTTLRVTPHVYERGGNSQIKLRVNIVDGSTSDQLVDSIPIVEESTINTQAIIDVGQSLLIGGLVREIKATGESRVPVLGRIPGLGALFRSQIKTTSRQERMFLITPRLSTPKIAGKRFSAPIHSGSETDIITSSATRMNTTREALKLLDEAYPLEQNLPRGETLTSNTVIVEPFQPVVPDASSGIEVDQGGSSSLRNRLPGSRQRKQAPVAEQLVVKVDPVVAPVAPKVNADEWQAVGGPVAPKVQTSDSGVTVFATPSALPIKTKTLQSGQSALQGGAAGADINEWQDVTQ